MFILILPQDKEAEEEVNDVSVHLFFIFISKPVIYPPPNCVIFFHPKSHNFYPNLCTQYRGHYDLMLNLLVITPS